MKYCYDNAYDFTIIPDFRKLIGLVRNKYSFQIDENCFCNMPLLLSKLITYTSCSHNNVNFTNFI